MFSYKRIALVVSVLMSSGSSHVLALDTLTDRTVRSAIAEYSTRYCVGDSSTAKAKRYDVGYFRGFLAASDISKIDELTPLVIREFVASREAIGESPATVRRRFDNIKHVLSFVEKRVSNFLNPAREVRSPFVPAQRPRGLNALELNALRKAAKSPIDRLVIELGARAGLRRETMTWLRFGQLEQGEQLWLRQVRIKGARYVDIPCPPTLAQAIREYIPVRSKILSTRAPGDEASPNYPLLVSNKRTQQGEPDSFRYSVEGIYQIVVRLGERAGIAAFPHKLRHTFAHDLLAATGNNLSHVASAMGHASIQTTLAYTRPSEDEKMEAAKKLA